MLVSYFLFRTIKGSEKDEGRSTSFWIEYFIFYIEF